MHPNPYFIGSGTDESNAASFFGFMGIAAALVFCSKTISIE
jgi:hypothetical protein